MREERLERASIARLPATLLSAEAVQVRPWGELAIGTEDGIFSCTTEGRPYSLLALSYNIIWNLRQ